MKSSPNSCKLTTNIKRILKFLYVSQLNPVTSTTRHY